MMRALLIALLLAGCAVVPKPPPPAVVTSLPDPELEQPRRVRPRAPAKPAEVAPPKDLVATVDSHTAEATRYAAWSGAKPANLTPLADLTAAATKAKRDMEASCHRGRCGKRQVDELLRANQALSDFLRDKQG